MATLLRYQIACQRLLLLAAAMLCAGTTGFAQEQATNKGLPAAKEVELTEEQRAWVEEKKDLKPQIEQLRAKDVAAALRVLERVLARDRELFGSNHEQTADTLSLYSDTYYMGYQYDLSASMRGEIYQIKKALYGEKDWRTLEARWQHERYKHFGKLSQQQHDLERQGFDNLSAAYDQFAKGEFQPSLTTAKKALAAFQQVYGEDAPPCADLLLHVANCYISLSDFAQAEGSLQAAGAIYRGWYSTASPAYAGVLSNLAELNSRRGNTAEAENLFRQAIALYEQIADAPPYYYADSLKKLAVLLRGSGQVARAMELQRRVLPIVETAVGREGREYVDAQIALAYTLMQINKLDETSAVLDEVEKSIAAHEALRSNFEADAKFCRARLLQQQGKHEQALTSLQACYEIYRRRFGENSLECGNTLAEIAAVYFAISRRGDAVQALERALAALVASVGPKHPSTRAVCNQLINVEFNEAQTLTLAGELAAARAKLEQSAKRAAEIFGPEDHETQLARDRLAYQAQLEQAAPEVRVALVESQKLQLQGDQLYNEKKYAEALDLFEQALEQRRPHFPADDLRMGELYYWIAYAAWGQGNYKRAEQAARLAEPGYARMAEASSTSEVFYARLLRDIGDLCRKRGAYAEAVDPLTRALDVYRRVKNASQDEILQTLDMQGNSYYQLSDFVHAEAVFREYVDRVERTSGRDHHAFVTALRKYADVFNYSGRFDQARQTYEQAREIAARLKLGPDWERALRADLASVDENSGNLEQAAAARAQIVEELRQSDDRASLLQALYTLHGLEMKRGRYAEAEQLASEGLKLAHELHGPDSGQVGNLENALEDACLRQANVAWNAHEYPKSVPVYERLVEQRIRRFGKDHWSTKEVRAFLAESQRLSKLKSDQLAELRKADEVFVEADKLFRADRRADALAASLRAAAAYRGVCGDGGLRYRDILGGVIDYHAVLEQFTESEKLHRRRLEIYAKVVSTESPYHADNQVKLAQNLQRQGRYSEALDVAKAAGDIYVRAGAQGEWQYGALLTLQGALCVNLGDYAGAQQTFDAAGTALAPHQATRPQAWHDYLRERINLAFALNDSAQMAQLAHANADWVRRTSGEESREYVVALLNLGRACNGLAKFDEAVQHLRRALALWGKFENTQNFVYAGIEYYLALAYMGNGELDLAVPLLEQAAQLFRAAGKTDNLLRAQIDLAQIHISLGQLARAEPLLREIIDGRKGALTTTDENHFAAVSQLSLVLRVRGDDAAAAPLVQDYLQFRERSLDAKSAIMTGRQETQWRNSFRVALDNDVALAARGHVPPDDVYAHVLRWKGSLFARERRLRALRENTQAAPLLERWGSLTGTLATLSLRAPYPEERAVWNGRVAALTADIDSLEKQLWALAKTQSASEATSLDSVRQALPSRTALVDFLEYFSVAPDSQSRPVYPRRLAAFVVRPEQAVELIDLGEVDFFNQAIEQWRAFALGSGDKQPDFAAVEQLGAQLRARLWGPVEKHLGEVDTVLVVPDGALGKFPLAALPGRESNSYLIDERAVAVIAVPSLLPELLSRARPADADNDESLLLVGNIDYGAAATSTTVGGERAVNTLRAWLPYHFSDLPGFSAEILDIQASFTGRFTGGKKVLLERERATEQLFRRQASQHRWLHVATHGFFAPDVMEAAYSATPQVQVVESAVASTTSSGAPAVNHEGLMSGLALAGANSINAEGQDDGILSALEVATLDLSNVEMAVLSACETGLGASISGEGVVGLQRAFQVAGARTTVTSLWPVSDLATRLLMARFYRNLWNKEHPMSRLEALREAQRWMLRAARAGGNANTDPKSLTADSQTLPASFQLPTFWAPFVLGGDWR